MTSPQYGDLEVDWSYLQENKKEHSDGENCNAKL